ncbi:YscQ/HrcQ family type III secretion apparatus protein [Agrobacterium larrymoorei]|uniref:FliM/FliN family flagellar motor switch protein n=1 Tax=Agrobacterium larrymoorei TaxID=160699 RepID=UPI0015718A96|nr:FliM/FliN family flagellar motor switch protein [Agrobacterium larrymoorei]NTJ41864.1 YscQ/HrcQ family type III secretion apparatus protein [Agrobacterium larrymoorei]
MTARIALSFEDAGLPLDRRFAEKKPWPLLTGAEWISIRPMRIELAAESITDPVYIRARIGDDDIVVKLSHNSLTLLCNRREPGLDWRNVHSQIKPLVLECILQNAFTKLEEICGCTIEITDVQDDDPSGFATNFACEIEVDGIAVPAGLLVSPAQLGKLQRWQHSLPGVMPSVLHIPINIRHGSATISSAELRSLRIGDAIVLGVAYEAAPVWAVTGERFLAEVTEQDDGLRLLTPLLSIPPSSMRHLMATSDDQEHHIHPVQGAVGDIPIRLVFDAGRIEVPLSELEGIGVGHVFDIGRHPSRSVDIVAQGRIIGHGEVVSVEGLTAVRITALNP